MAFDTQASSTAMNNHKYKDDYYSINTNLMYASLIYHQTSTISHTLVCSKIVNHSGVVGASPVGAAPTTSSFSTYHLASMYWTKTTTRQDDKH